MRKDYLQGGSKNPTGNLTERPGLRAPADNKARGALYSRPQPIKMVPLVQSSLTISILLRFFNAPPPSASRQVISLNTSRFFSSFCSRTSAPGVYEEIKWGIRSSLYL